MKPDTSDRESRATVLIVDDNPNNLSFLFERLDDSGFKVLVALSGDEALSLLELVHPDLILLDVLMPGIDGFEACRQLKANPDTRDIPVIFMSALVDPRDKVRAFDAGAVDYITKPVDEREVRARVDTQLSLQALQRELEARNAQLAAQRAELAEQNEALSAFGRMVAHDLKGGLGRIIGYSELLIEVPPEGMDDEQLEDLQSIHDAGLEMQRVIDAMLILGGITRAEIAVAPLDMAAVVARARLGLEDDIARRSARVTEPDTWPQARGYAPWVERVWANYLSNGLKYGGTPPDLVLGADPGASGTISFWVRDNGPGIPEEARDTVFDSFTRLHEGPEVGHGLGLNIVRRVVSRLGGETGCRPLAGGGTEFYFTLPGDRSAGED